jgi:hypothetical protein
MVERGCPLGVATVVSGRQYEATAETQEPSEISFLRQFDLLRPSCASTAKLPFG